MSFASPPDRARQPNLLIADDDANHCWALKHAFENRGYAVRTANCVPHALSLIFDWPVRYAVVDLRMPGPSGLTLVARLKMIDPETRIVVTTGYSSVATAVEAIKLGAVHYLPKPVDADMIEAAFWRVRGDEKVAPSRKRISVERLAWEHIQGALAENRGNVSAAARTLGMHRRTLQRRLTKFPRV
jgi:two-component system, response regulator RegA